MPAQEALSSPYLKCSWLEAKNKSYGSILSLRLESKAVIGNNLCNVHNLGIMDQSLFSCVIINGCQFKSKYHIECFAWSKSIHFLTNPGPRCSNSKGKFYNMLE